MLFCGMVWYGVVWSVGGCGLVNHRRVRRGDRPGSRSLLALTGSQLVGATGAGAGAGAGAGQA